MKMYKWASSFFSVNIFFGEMEGLNDPLLNFPQCHKNLLRFRWNLQPKAVSNLEIVAVFGF